jgi:hydroxymethylbilane synthase
VKKKRMKNKIVIGTRGSQLAIYQAEKVKSDLIEVHPHLQVEIRIIHTKGDKILDVALSKIGDKALFTKEIENALLDGSADIAVHSLKDLPTTLPEGLLLGAVLKRGESRDALISIKGKKIKDLTPNDVIATSSLRRQAALLNFNPMLQLKDIRGNVNTRIKKLEEGYCDAMIMAAAGFQRLKLDRYISEIIEPTVIMPAIAQGAIAIEIRKNDPETTEIIQAVNHIPTWQAIIAERAFLRTLEGGCQVPIGSYSQIDGDQIILNGFVASVDGKQMIKENIRGSIQNVEECGILLAKKMLDKGAAKILSEINRNS